MLQEYQLSIPNEGIFISPIAQFWNLDIDNKKEWRNNKFEDYYPCFWNHYDKRDDVYEIHNFSKGWGKRNWRSSFDKTIDNPSFVNLAISLVLIRKGKLQLY